MNRITGRTSLETTTTTNNKIWTIHKKNQRARNWNMVSGDVLRPFSSFRHVARHETFHPHPCSTASTSPQFTTTVAVTCTGILCIGIRLLSGSFDPIAITHTPSHFKSVCNQHTKAKEHSNMY